MDKYVESDMYRWTGEKNGKKQKRKLKRIPQFQLIYYKRKCEKYRGKNKIIFGIYSLVYRKLKIKYLTDIPAKTQMGYGFVVEHLGGIAINPKTVIGNNVNIYNGVTIGVEKRGERKGTPVIGSEVWIGANAVIVGNVHIGNNVLVAPNSFVNFSVPDDSIVVGNPAKVIHNKEACAYYIKNKYLTSEG